MHAEQLAQVIALADDAINREDFDALMQFYAEDAVLVVLPGKLARGRSEIRAASQRIAEFFRHTLKVSQGERVVLEGGDTALVLADTVVEFTNPAGAREVVRRKATYVFRREADGAWRCIIDNSYGTELLGAAPGILPANK
jgi:uncharacterized protein (TIGR02246 family)